MSIATLRPWARALALPILFATAVLAGCGGEDPPQSAAPAMSSGGSTANSSAGTAQVAGLPSTTATPSPTAGNTAPMLSGTPPATINAGSGYSFAPAASDADGDRLALTIAGKPSWASFDTVTGALTGTPAAADIGIYAGISITVSDGQVTRSIGPFDIAVTQFSTGSAMLSWVPPTLNTDGSVLTNLSGFIISFGRSASALDQTITLSNASISRYLVENLSSGTWYFMVKAVANGMESAGSSIASKAIP